MTVTITDLHEQLRIDTARMLQYDINALTPAQEVRLLRAAMLRLELDDVQTKKLAGQPFDMNKYIIASETLERLVGGQPEQTNGPDHDAALLQVDAMIGRLIAAKEHADHERDADRMWREEMAAVIAAGGDVEAAPIEPEPTKPPRSDNVIPIDATARANANLPPAHYLRDGQRGTWRDHYDGHATGPHPWPLAQ